MPEVHFKPRPPKNLPKTIRTNNNKTSNEAVKLNFAILTFTEP